MVARRYASSPPTFPPFRALYLQFSFVNNKPWRRRGSDFNEGINNLAERGRRPEGGKRTALVGSEGESREGQRVASPGEFMRVYTQRGKSNDHNRVDGEGGLRRRIDRVPRWPMISRASCKWSFSVLRTIVSGDRRYRRLA